MMEEMAGRIIECKKCGKALEKKQIYRKQNYCSRECFHNARFGDLQQYCGIETRRPKVIEAAKLCRSGLTQKETAAIVGVHPRMVSDWFERYGAEKMRGERFCIHCGQSLAGTDIKRKYCSQACENKVNYARQHPEGRSRMEFDPVLREKGLELYWGGLDQHAISRQLGVAEGTVGCWIHRYGGLRERRKIPEVMAMRPFKRRLKEAKDVDEWTQILSEAVRAGPSGSAIQLVCGTVSGQCEISHYAAMIADVLKLDPCSGEMFAFCNKSGKSISVIQWRHGAFRLVRIPKRRGCYLWPGEKMGKCGVVFMNEFNYLLQYEKNHARKLKKVEK